MVHVYAVIGTRPNNNICSARESRNTGASTFSFTISVLGSFTCITQHMGPTALRPIRRTKQLWLSVLLKDTSAATGQARIRTHIKNTVWQNSNRCCNWTSFYTAKKNCWRACLRWRTWKSETGDVLFEFGLIIIILESEDDIFVKM